MWEKFFHERPILLKPGAKDAHCRGTQAVYLTFGLFSVISPKNGKNPEKTAIFETFSKFILALLLHASTDFDATFCKK